MSGEIRLLFRLNAICSKPGRNLIEIVYQPAERNAMIAAAKAGDARVAQYRKRAEEVIPAGLRGPVQIDEYR